MNLLLDTHAIIWFLNGEAQLSNVARDLIEDEINKKYVSIISIWEISIKLGLEKLEFDGNTKEVVDLIKQNGFEILFLTPEHAFEYETLQFIHRDPFDRMLVAQAKVDGLQIVTKDGNIQKYEVVTKW